MVTISKPAVTKAKPIDPTNWLTVRDVFGPQEIPDPSPRGDCVVLQADTLPQNNAAEWSQIAWSGGEPIPSNPNQRRVSRQATGTTTITASIGTRTQKTVSLATAPHGCCFPKKVLPPPAKPSRA